MRQAAVRQVAVWVTLGPPVRAGAAGGAGAGCGRGWAAGCVVCGVPAATGAGAGAATGTGAGAAAAGACTAGAGAACGVGAGDEARRRVGCELGAGRLVLAGTVGAVPVAAGADAVVTDRRLTCREPP